MNNSKKISVALSWLALSFTVALVVASATGRTPAQTAAKPLDKKTVLQKALQSYYILQNQGLKSFQCVVQPDWKKLMDTETSKPANGEDPRLAMLSPVQYSVEVDKQGDPKITPIRPTGGTPDSSVDQM